MRLVRRVSAMMFALTLGSSGLAIAETGVVMKDGSVVKCEKYEQKGNIYVLTMANGKLVSMRADKVDLEATAGYDEKMKAQAEAAAQMKATPVTADKPATAAAPKEQAVALTNEDLKKYEGQPSSMGDQSTVTAEAGEMPDRSDYEKLEKQKSGGGEAAPAKTEDAPKGEKSDKSDDKRDKDGN